MTIAWNRTGSGTIAGSGRAGTSLEITGAGTAGLELSQPVDARDTFLADLFALTRSANLARGGDVVWKTDGEL